MYSVSQWSLSFSHFYQNHGCIPLVHISLFIASYTIIFVYFDLCVFKQEIGR
jgi:hypothetical protein